MASTGCRRSWRTRSAATSAPRSKRFASSCPHSARPRAAERNRKAKSEKRKAAERRAADSAFVFRFSFSAFRYPVAMPQIDVDRLIWIVVGIQLNAELGDRPLAYRIEQELKRRIGEKLGPPPPGEPPRLAPVVI